MSERRTPLRGLGIARVGLCALIVASPLLLGGVPTWAPAVLFPLALASFAFSVWGRRDVKVPMLALVPLGVAAICLVQVAPLPGFLLELLSPTSAGLRDFALVPLGLSSWRPVSLDPSATWREALKWALYASTVLSAICVTRDARSSASRLLPLQCVAITGGLLVVAAGLHPLLGFNELFGLYQFKQASPPLLTPFGNPNHLAGFLLLAGTLSGGLLLESREPLHRLAWASCWAACCAGILISNSRGGIGAFVVTQAALVVVALWRVGKDRDGALPNAVRLSLIATVAAVAAVGALGDRLFARFADTSSALNKFAQWPHGLELVRDCWRLGAGRGAYEVAFTRYYADHAGKTFTHPENIVLQWTAEVGVPLAMAFAVGAGLALYRLWKGSARSHWEIAALLAGVGVALHNFLDFNLEYPGVSVPLAAVLGVVAGASPQLIFKRFPVWAVAVALAATGALGAWQGRDSPAAADQRLFALADVSTPAKTLQRAALREIDRHPSDYFLYDLVARAWIAEGDAKEALAFANRALWLFPNDSTAHIVAARALRAMGKRSQALLEYRLAAETGANNTNAIVGEAAAYAKNLDELWILTGGTIRWVRQLANSVPKIELATSLLLRGGSEFATDPGVEEIVLDAVRNLVKLNRPDDARTVLDHAAAALAPSPQLMLARVLLEKSAGNSAAMDKALDEGLKRWPGQFELTCERLQAVIAGKRWHEARALLARANASATDSSHRIELTLSEAEVDMAAGLTVRALDGFRTAVRLAPSSRTHSALARALSTLKHYDESVAELRAAQRFESEAGGKAIETAIETIEAARDAEQIRPNAP